MPLNEIRHPLCGLLDAIVAEPGVFPGYERVNAEPSVQVRLPDDLRDQAKNPFGLLWLTGDTARQYYRCLGHLLEEGEDGELEHLAQRDIERAFERLVCEAWLQREALRPNDRRAMANRFIAAHRRPHETWAVLWEIKDLGTAEPFSIAGVEFLPFTGGAAEQWMHPEENLLREIQVELVGRTFACATVRAGRREKALLRGKTAIDDALHVLRFALATHRLLPEQQLLHS